MGVLAAMRRHAGEICSSGATSCHERAERRDVLWRRSDSCPQSSMNALDPVYRVGAQMLEVLRLRGGYAGAADARAR